MSLTGSFVMVLGDSRAASPVPSPVPIRSNLDRSSLDDLRPRQRLLQLLDHLLGKFLALGEEQF